MELILYRGDTHGITDHRDAMRATIAAWTLRLVGPSAVAAASDDTSATTRDGDELRRTGGE
jgi:hypothetical protein